jgi:hypothetical protein
MNNYPSQNIIGENNSSLSSMSIGSSPISSTSSCSNDNYTKYTYQNGLITNCNEQTLWGMNGSSNEMWMNGGQREYLEQTQPITQQEQVPAVARKNQSSAQGIYFDIYLFLSNLRSFRSLSNVKLIKFWGFI